MSEITAVPLRPIKRGALTALWAGVGVLVAAGVGAAWAGTERQVAMAKPAAEYLAANARRDGVRTTASGLQYQVIAEGKGPRATVQDVALVDYDGSLRDGTSFDSTAKAGQPAVLPVGQMIPGFTEGLQLMNRGARYKFWIPSELGYGARPVPDPRTGQIAIPADSVLIFDVTLRELMPAAAMGGMPGMGGGSSPHGDMPTR